MDKESIKALIRLHKKLALKYASEGDAKAFEIQTKRIEELEEMLERRMALCVRRT